jgi:CRP-like cAMP-binding protein
MIETYAPVFHYVGVLGACLYPGSYAALQLGFIRGQTYTYAILNACASGAVLISLVIHFNLSSAIVNASWVLISLLGIMRLFWIGRMSRRCVFTAEESRFISSKFPALSKHLARKFLGSGYWVDGEPGVVLTREGEPVVELVYLERGEAAVALNDQIIGFCFGDTYIGELTCMTGAPATATVSLAVKSRYFCISSESLRKLARSNSHLAQAIDHSFAGVTRKKLVMAGVLDQKNPSARPIGQTLGEQPTVN